MAGLPATWEQVGDPRVRRALLTAVACAGELGLRVWIAGGWVRDGLLGVESSDLDFVLEEGADRFAAALVERLGGRPEEHPPFGTIALRGLPGVGVDVAMARSESYSRPASLPEVEPAGLETDLARRDYSVNAMAAPVQEPGPGKVVDPWEGRDDLERGLLRVLHDRSFVDDPSRILRGVALEGRLGLRLEGATRRLAAVACEEGTLGLLSGARLWAAWRRCLADPPRIWKLRRLEEIGVLAGIDAALEAGRGDRPLPEHLDGLAVGEEDREPGLAALMALLWGRSPEECRRVARRFGLQPSLEKRLEGLGEGIGEGVRLLEGERRTPHEIVEALGELGVEERELLWAMAPASGVKEARRALAADRGLRLRIGGEDLLAAGFPAGRRIGAALRATRAARLDGQIGPEEELRHALSLLRGEDARSG